MKENFILINLLPYREEKRKEKKKNFILLLTLVAVINGFILFLLGSVSDEQLSLQQSRNDFLEAKNKDLDKQIKEISGLKEDVKLLLARKSVVETLQDNRSDAVNEFSQLAKTIPEGIYLKTVSQVGDRLTLVGVTQSNTKVATYIQNLDSSGFFTNANLIEIKEDASARPISNNPNTTVDLSNMNKEFTLVVDIDRSAQLAHEAEMKKKDKMMKGKINSSGKVNSNETKGNDSLSFLGTDLNAPKKTSASVATSVATNNQKIAGGQ